MRETILIDYTEMDVSYDDSIADKDFNMEKEKESDSESEEQSNSEEQVPEIIEQQKNLVQRIRITESNGSDSEEENQTQSRRERKAERWSKMLEHENTPSGFIPDKRDILFEKEFQARINTRSEKYLTAKVMTPKAVLEKLEKGERLDPHKRRYEVKTTKTYIWSLRQLIGLWQQVTLQSPDASKLVDNKLHYSNFLQFGSQEFIVCSQVMVEILNKSGRSGSIKSQMLISYIHLLNIIWEKLHKQGAVSYFKLPVNKTDSNMTIQQKQLLDLQLLEAAEKWLDKQKARIIGVKQDINIKQPLKVWQAEQRSQKKALNSIKINIQGEIIPDPNIVITAFLNSNLVIKVKAWFECYGPGNVFPNQYVRRSLSD